MKRICTLITLCALLLLSACGKNATETRWESFSDELSAAESFGFTAELRAEYEDKSLCFTLQYEQRGELGTVTVIAPEELRGVRTTTREGGRDLEYYGFVIDTGRLDDELTPVSALPALAEAMCGAYADCFWHEGDCAVVRLIASDALSMTLWLDEMSFTPRHAELESGGRVRVFCDIWDWHSGD